MFQSTTSLPVSAASVLPKSAKRFSAATVPFSAGVGFGPSGEGYIRLTAFGRREDCEEAMKRLKSL